MRSITEDARARIMPELDIERPTLSYSIE
ncbi:uncharacterized protein METZ01_LOCUS477453, partial [marine metagenome]